MSTKIDQQTYWQTSGKTKKNIPVVMLSAKDTPKETAKAKELGADDFIPKPFRDEELVNKIHELIGQ